MPFDEPLLRLINGQWTCVFLDWFSAIVTASELWIPLLVATVLLLAWRGSPRCRLACGMAFIVFGIGDGIFVHAGKVLTQRPRPREVLDGVRMVHLAKVEPRITALRQPLRIRSSVAGEFNGLHRSFPSGHAWNGFAFATLVFLCSRRWAWLAFPVAGLVAYSRVYGGQHWPSDVLASMVFAPLVTLGIVWSCEQAWLLLGQRVSPRLFPSAPRILARDPAT